MRLKKLNMYCRGSYNAGWLLKVPQTSCTVFINFHLIHRSCEVVVNLLQIWFSCARESSVPMGLLHAHKRRLSAEFKLESFCINGGIGWNDEYSRSPPRSLVHAKMRQKIAYSRDQIQRNWFNMVTSIHVPIPILTDHFNWLFWT